MSSLELERLRQLAVPLFLLDGDGVFVWINDAFARTFGEVTGRDYSAVVAPETVARTASRLRRALAQAAASECTVFALTVDGERRRIDVSSVALRNAQLFGVVVGGFPRAERLETTRSLTPRELDVVSLLAAGSSTEQIADELHITKATVKNHIRNLMQSLGVHSRLEAVAAAREGGLL